MSDTLRDVLDNPQIPDHAILKNTTVGEVRVALAARNVVLARGDAPTPEPLREAAQYTLDRLDSMIGDRLSLDARGVSVDLLRAALAATEEHER